MSKLLYVTFHGGKSGISNIVAWNKDGGTTPAIPAVLDTTGLGHDLDELRGFFVAGDGTLYLANAYKSTGSTADSVGEILQFDKPDSSGKRKYLTTVLRLEFGYQSRASASFRRRPWA